MKEKLGVIGGMGPEATSYFFEEIILNSETAKDQDHLDIVILNHASLPDRTEAILSKKEDDLVELLIADAKTLEKLEVKNIAIPCNTSHYFYEKVQKETSIPIIHMVKETISYILEEFSEVKKIGIMGTNGTIQAGVYHKEGEAQGVEVLSPSTDAQADVMSLIYDDIKQGKPGDKEKFQRAYDNLMQQGAEVVILACTELSVFKKTNEVPENCVDAMDVLVKEAIERSNGRYR